MLLNCGVEEESSVSWTTRRSSQFILKEINPEYSLQGLMLKLQYFSHLMWRTDSLEKILILQKIEGGRRRGQQSMWDGWMASLMWWTWVWVGARSWWWRGKPGMVQCMGSQRVGHDWATGLNWTDNGHIICTFVELVNFNALMTTKNKNMIKFTYSLIVSFM